MLLPCMAERRAAEDAVAPEEITENSDADVKTRRVSAVLFWIPYLVTVHGSGLSPNGRFITSSPSASAQNSFLCSITVYVK